jgi:hypothetical protein
LILNRKMTDDVKIPSSDTEKSKIIEPENQSKVNL